MSVKIHISPHLSHLANNQIVTDVRGNNVGQCLSQVVDKFPDLKTQLFNNNGELNNNIEVFVNQKSSYPEGLAKTVEDGDEIHIVEMIVGG